jgi:hypothetical protein
MQGKLERLNRTLPVDTICCCCKGTKADGTKVNHLRDVHGTQELQHLRDQYYEQPTEEARKAFLKAKLRPEDTIEGEHVGKFELNGSYVCWDGVKKLFGVSKNLLCCVAATQNCFKRGGPNASRRPRNQHPHDFMKWDYVSAWLGMKKRFYEIQPDRREVHAPWAHRR